VVSVGDGDGLSIGGRELRFIDTPGHARHHFCVWDRQTRGWFTGDTFGISYRDLDTASGAFIFPTTTPIQFDPGALIRSVERLMEEAPKFMYLTHFGRVPATDRLARRLIAGVRKLEEIARRRQDSPQRTADIESDMREWLMEACRAHGVTFSDERLAALLQPDVELNTQGVEYWLDHEQGS
jgi:glyoxylase-like metal-dependent hydrolase (beta-lactamase superfamily II)